MEENSGPWPGNNSNGDTLKDSASVNAEPTNTALPFSNSADMEIHHHPDLHHKRKKLKEYFLEFFMIFLAVTLGFFADSLRERISDSNKEHEYMQSLLNDLRTDSLKIEYTISDNQHKSAQLDSLMKLMLQGFSNAGDSARLYKLKGYAGSYSIFEGNDATMQQLKNSGGLRMVRKDHVADSIARYDYELKIIYAAETCISQQLMPPLPAARKYLIQV